MQSALPTIATPSMESFVMREKPVYIPSVESFNQREAEREEARWTSDLLKTMLVGGCMVLAMWSLLIITY